MCCSPYRNCKHCVVYGLLPKSQELFFPPNTHIQSWILSSTVTFYFVKAHFFKSILFIYHRVRPNLVFLLLLEQSLDLRPNSTADKIYLNTVKTLLLRRRNFHCTFSPFFLERWSRSYENNWKHLVIKWCKRL